MNASSPHGPTHRAIDLLQEKWTLHIVRALLVGPHGFNELGRAAGGCNPTTLTQRLGRLETFGLIVRTAPSEGPPRYALTPAGRDLEAVVVAIDRWAGRHLAGTRRSRPRS